jgi:PKD repeat protein
VQEVSTYQTCLIAHFNVGGDGHCSPWCFENPIHFSDSSYMIDVSLFTAEMVQWEWDFGDGITEIYTIGNYEPIIYHDYEHGGEYRVSLRVTAISGSVTLTDEYVILIVFNLKPIAVIEAENACESDTMMFTDASILGDDPIETRTWYFGDPYSTSDSSNSINPGYMYPTYGSYTATLIILDEHGCKDTTTKDVIVHELPVAKFSHEETCMSYYTYFTDESESDSYDIEQYFWNFGDTLTLSDTSSLKDSYYLFDSTGYYTVQLSITDENQCVDTISHNIEMYNIPTSSFVIMDTTQQGQIYLDNTSEQAIDYYWDFDYDYGVSSDEQNPMHQYEIDGVYNIMLVSFNEYNCPDTTYQLYDLLFTNLFVPNAFMPSSPNSELNVFKPKGINLRSYHLEIYSAWGNLVFRSIQLLDGSPAEGWDGTYKGKSMPTGSYMWRISAMFEDGTHWKGTDNGDGNTETSGTVTLIR